MTRIQKRRRQCSRENTSASAVDSRPAAQENAAASVDSRPAPQNASASAADPRPATQEKTSASAIDSRPALQENASASALDSRPVSSFEFSVASEQGINLYVDLNSSLVDWHKRLENGICICQCLEENKFQSFREELLYLGNNRKQRKDSFGCKSDSRIMDGNASFISTPESVINRSDNSLLNHPDAKNMSLETFAAEVCSFVQEESEHLEGQKELPVSISSNLGIRGMISSPRPEEIESMDLTTFHAHQGKIPSCSLESLATDGPQATLNDKNMKLRGEISINVKIKKGRNVQNATPLPVSSGISAIESKLSEVGCLENDTACSFSNDPLLNLIDVAHSMGTGLKELANSAEEQASGDPVNGTEDSCKSEKAMSDGGLKQKRYKRECDKVSLQFSGRVLRSALRPRRSRRLVSKVVNPF